MTKELIDQRRAALVIEHQTAVATRDNGQRLVDATSGAIQDCDWWLAEIAKAEKLVNDAVPTLENNEHTS